MTTASTKTRSSLVSNARIRRVVEQIAALFSPVKVVLFGSYATGQAREESDVDLLIVLERRVSPESSLRIRRAIKYDFPLDLVVIQRRRLERRVMEGDFFLQDILKTGKVLYEQIHS
jgi:predicted nucleotidyltransferase